MRSSLLGAPLPSVVPNFTGRQGECEEIIRHVSSESTRLVSMWGSPGFGKTSVAIAVAHALQSQGLPVYWVSLRGVVFKADLASQFLRKSAFSGNLPQQNNLLVNVYPSMKRFGNFSVMFQSHLRLSLITLTIC